jgi:hypothetical protein
VSGRTLKRLLDAVPADREAEERAWRIVEASYADRRPLPRATRMRPALVLAALAVAVAAAVLSPPGRAVVDAVRRTIGIEHAATTLFRLPAPGRLLVSGPGGTWVVASDGSKRRLGDYTQASWSPHGLFVVAAAPDQLTTLEPTGRVHWTLARPRIRFPRWGGTRTDTRIAYLAGSRLHVVAGDGTGDSAPAGLPNAAPAAPAWRPAATARHVLAYLTADGRVVVLDTGAGRRWARARPAGSRLLAWSPDGTRLAVAGGSRVVLFDPLGRHTRAVPARGVRAVAFAPDGRLALLRGRTILVVSGSRVRTVFAAPGRLSGLAWSPDGKWLLTSLRRADQWVFVQAGGAHRVLGVAHIARQFGGTATLDGWVPPAPGP